MKCIVVGSTGFLGKYLCYYLSKKEVEVIGLSRKNKKRFNGINIEGEMEDYPRIIEEEEADIVINTVAITKQECCEKEPEKADKTNSLMAEKMAEASKKTNKYFIQISTDAVFDGKSTKKYKENDETKPISIYGQTKLRGENAVLKKNPNALIIRTNFFGWSSDSQKGILDFFYESLLKGKYVDGYEDYIVSSLYVGDLVDTILEVITKKAQGIMHIAAQKGVSKYEFACKIAKLAKLEETLIRKCKMKDNKKMKERGNNLSLSSKKVEKMIGKKMETTESGLKRAFREREALMCYFGCNE